MEQHDRTAATECRLVARRAAPQVSAARWAGRRQKAQDGGKNPCPKGLLRDGWHLMLANPSRADGGGRIPGPTRSRAPDGSS
jgi:hypothetical protein